MSPASLPTGPCEQTTGFLFSHECGVPAAAACPRCGKRVCDAHLSAVGGELLCTTCAEEEDEDADDAESEGDADSDASTDEDDPSYYYQDYGAYGPGSAWSRGGGTDPNDFTEADGESLRHEEDASFEEDLGGS